MNQIAHCSGGEGSASLPTLQLPSADVSDNPSSHQLTGMSSSPSNLILMTDRDTPLVNHGT